MLKVKGFNNRIIERLRNYVSVLPKTDTKVNVNFAKEEVLMAVTGMVRAEAKEMVRLRSGNYYKSVDDFDKRWQRKNRPLNPDLVTVQSDFFWVTGTATVGKAKVETQVLVERGIDPRLWPTVKWQSVQ